MDVQLNIGRILSRITLLLLVLSGGSIPFVFYRNELSILLLVVSILTLFFYTSKSSRTTLFSAVKTGLILLTGLVVNYLFAFGEQSVLKYGFFSLMILTVVIVNLHYSRFNFRYKQDLYTVLKWIMYHGLFNAFAYLFVSGSLVELSNDYYQCSAFKNIFYYIPWINDYAFPGGLTLCRNQGLFWEPGVFQIFLNILLYLELFVVKRSKINLFLTVLVILTTYSTTGLILMVVQLIISFFYLLNRNLFWLPFGLAGLLVVLQFVGGNVEEKLYGEKEDSAQIRMFDLIQPLNIVRDHPFTGIGIDNNNYAKVSAKYFSNMQGVNYTSLEKGNTNSVMYSLAIFGIPFTLLMLYAVLKQPFLTERKGVFMTVFFFSVFFEPVLFKQFFFFFVVAGLIHIFNKIKLSNG